MQKNIKGGNKNICKNDFVEYGYQKFKSLQIPASTRKKKLCMRTSHSVETEKNFADRNTHNLCEINLVNLEF